MKLIVEIEGKIVSEHPVIYPSDYNLILMNLRAYVRRKYMDKEWKIYKQVVARRGGGTKRIQITLKTKTVQQSQK